MKNDIGFSTPTGEIFDSLLSGVQWFSDGSPLELTYSFPDQNSEFVVDLSFGYETTGGNFDEPFRSGFSELSEHYQELTLNVFANIESIINVTFTEVDDSVDSDIRISVTDINDFNTAAYSYLPLAKVPYSDADVGQPQEAMFLSGDIWLSSQWLSTVDADSSFIYVINHEIGHAIGLDHSFENGLATTPFAENNILTDTALDYGRYTAMSYGRWPETINESDISYETSAQTMMPLDVDALQSMYGASQNSNDDVYFLLGPSMRDYTGQLASYATEKDAIYHEIVNGYTTIVDNGGYNELWLQIDNNLVIDLQSGTWSDTYGGYQLTDGNQRDPNLFIHESTIIHEIHTGDGNDVITGNNSDNIIQTYSGNDEISAGFGDDTVYAGRGNDVISLGFGNDTYIGHSGDDLLIGGGGFDTADFQDVSLAAYRFSFQNNGDVNAINLFTSETLSLKLVENLRFAGEDFKTLELYDALIDMSQTLIKDVDVTPYLSRIENVNEDTDISALEAQLYRTYMGGVGRAPDRGGFNWWMEQLQTGELDLDETANRFLDSPEFASIADIDKNGDISNTEMLDHMYQKVFGREPDIEGYNWWLDQLDSGDLLQEEAFNDMTQSDEFVMLTANTVSEWLFT